MRMAQQMEIQPVITSVRRNWAQQSKLHENYRLGLSKFPANAPGDSAHQYGVAWDSWVPPADQEMWNRIRAHWGWKLYPHDEVHAEFPNWRAYISRLRLT